MDGNQKGVQVYGYGAEYLENFMLDPRIPRETPYEMYGKYLEEFDRNKAMGKRSKEEDVNKVHDLLVETFRKKCSSLDEANLYAKKMEESWPMMKEFLMENPARVHYWMDWVVLSTSFYDAMRRVRDPKVPNSTVMEASRGTTFDVAGKYGKLDICDPSFWFDVWFPIMLFPRERAFFAVSIEIKADRILSIGCGGFPQFRQYGYPLWRIKQQEIVGIDLVKSTELDTMFLYDHGVKFEETGITILEGDAVEVLKAKDYVGYFDAGDALGVFSYLDDEKAIELLALIMRGLEDGALFVLDLQILDDIKDDKGNTIVQGSLKFVVKMFGWSEELKLKPEASVEAAHARVQKWCDVIDGCEIVQEIIDERNPVPVGVTFVLGKNWMTEAGEAIEANSEN